MKLQALKFELLQRDYSFYDNCTRIGGCTYRENWLEFRILRKYFRSYLKTNEFELENSIIKLLNEKFEITKIDLKIVNEVRVCRKYNVMHVFKYYLGYNAEFLFYKGQDLGEELLNKKNEDSFTSELENKLNEPLFY